MREKFSFFTIASETLDQYDLPAIHDIDQYTKMKWKHVTKTAVATYWTRVLTEDADQRSTLTYCNIPSLEIGSTHPVWDTVKPNTNDVKMGITKVRLLTGTYLLQSNRSKFNKYEVDDTCPLCRLGPEDREHLITRCPALAQCRLKGLREIRNIISTKCGEDTWSKLTSKHIITALIIDCTTLARKGILPDSREMLSEIEVSSRIMCHKLHVRRLFEQRKLLQ